MVDIDDYVVEDDQAAVPAQRPSQILLEPLPGTRKVSIEVLTKLKKKMSSKKRTS